MADLGLSHGGIPLLGAGCRDETPSWAPAFSLFLNFFLNVLFLLLRLNSPEKHCLRALNGGRGVGWRKG